VAALDPSPDTALIVAVVLPPGLEQLRLLHVPDAASEGIPPHVTLLYPFARPGQLDDGVHLRIASIVASHAAWNMTLAGLGRWPDTLYATVQPDAPVRALQSELAAAFPDLPLYGRTDLRFEPHVTVAEGPGARDPSVATAAAWWELPVVLEVGSVELIVRERGRWRVARSFPLASSGADRL